MCWNREVSLVSGTTAVALSVYLFLYGKGNDIPVALVSFAIALMQFAEAEMWQTVETGTPGSGGQLGVLALFLQPLVLGLGIWWARKGATWIGVGFLALWSILALPTLLPLLQKEWPAAVGTCGHLQWSFLEPMLASPFAPLYWSVMLFGWLFLKPVWEGVWYSGIAIVTLVVTRFMFPGEWGSLWCFLANVLPLGRLI